MITIDSLPKSIKYNNEVYFLHLGVTAWNKICVCYQYAFGPCEAMEKKIEYSILSQVVESDNVTSNYSDNVEDIVDVNSTEMAFNVLSSRVNAALSNNFVELYK